MFVFDALCELSEESRLPDACHVFEAYFFGSCFDELVGDVVVVVEGVDG